MCVSSCPLISKETFPPLTVNCPQNLSLTPCHETPRKYKSEMLPSCSDFKLTSKPATSAVPIRMNKVKVKFKEEP